MTRRQGREWALQMLCQFDVNPVDSLEDAMASFWQQQLEIENEQREEFPDLSPVIGHDEKDLKAIALFAEIRAFAEERVVGVMNSRAALDAELEPFLDNWSFYRLGLVERNVLRLGAWEIKNVPSIPAPIAINEAVDLSKYFSETKSGRFVNAVLDKYAKNLAEQPQVFQP